MVSVKVPPTCEIKLRYIVTVRTSAIGRLKKTGDRNDLLRVHCAERRYILLTNSLQKLAYAVLGKLAVGCTWPSW